MESKAVTLSVPSSHDDGRGLLISFRWRDDRFDHVVSVIGGGELISSVEGDDQQDWPPSPPFQEATPHGADHAPHAILLVGMAGKSHWSASAERSGDSPRIVFDVACRLTAAPTCLGSSYRVVGGSCQSASVFESSGCRIQTLPIDGVMSCRLQEDEQGLRVTPTTLTDPPTTIRWRYAVEML